MDKISELTIFNRELTRQNFRFLFICHEIVEKPSCYKKTFNGIKRKFTN